MRNSLDTALILFTWFINTTPNDVPEYRRMLWWAYARSFFIHSSRGNHSLSYEMAIESLRISKEIEDLAFRAKSYTNIGSVYRTLGKHSSAKDHYLKALDLHFLDSTIFISSWHNIALIWIETGHPDKALYFLNKAKPLSERHNNAFLDNILRDIAWIYQKNKQYDLANYYFRLALQESQRQGTYQRTSGILARLGMLFFEINKIDSALFYIDLSNAIAEKHGFLRVIMHNYRTLFEIEKSRACYASAFGFLGKYTAIRDSMNNAERLGEIAHLRRSYEFSEINKQIEQAAIERQIKERIINRQLIILFVTWGGGGVVILFFVILFLQKRKLNTAYKVLVEKNIEIASIQKGGPNDNSKRYTLTQDAQEKLWNKILALMEDTSVICDTEFSIEKLAEMLQSNSTYISQVINLTSKKNFRSFLNYYRVMEAQRLFSEPDMAKYTVESIGLKVGFKSRSRFFEVFQEITGVSPHFYLKSLQKKADN